MFGDYFRHLLISRAHAHFPDFERPVRTTIEDEQGFISVIREANDHLRIESDLIKKMKKNFLEYLNRRSGSIKSAVIPCEGTVGRWNKRRSMDPVMELTYSCFDTVYYANWIESDILDRLVWSNIIPVVITNAHCPHGSKTGIIFIID